MSALVIPKTVTNKTIEDFINNLSLESLEVTTITDTGGDILINNTSGGDIRIQTSGGNVVIPEIIEQPPAVVFTNVLDTPTPSTGLTALFCDGTRLALKKSDGTRDNFLSMRAQNGRTTGMYNTNNVVDPTSITGSMYTFNDNMFLYIGNSNNNFEVNQRNFRFDIDMNDVFSFIDTVSQVTGSLTLYGTSNKIANGVATTVAGTSRVTIRCRGIDNIGGESLTFSIMISGSYTKNIP